MLSECKYLWLERSVFGLMLINNDMISDVIEWVELNDYTFSHPANNEIFETLRFLYQLGCPVDVVGLKNALEDSGMLGTAVDVVDLAHILDAAPCGCHVKEILEKLKDGHI